MHMSSHVFSITLCCLVLFECQPCHDEHEMTLSQLLLSTISDNQTAIDNHQSQQPSTLAEDASAAGKCFDFEAEELLWKAQIFSEQKVILLPKRQSALFSELLFSAETELTESRLGCQFLVHWQPVAGPPTPSYCHRVRILPQQYWNWEPERPLFAAI